MRTRYLRLRRTTPMARAAHSMLDTIAHMERGGCRVLSAHLLPMPSVRVDRQPPDLDSFGCLQPPPFTCRHYVAEHWASVNGVRVTWFARTGRQQP